MICLIKLISSIILNIKICKLLLFSLVNIWIAVDHRYTVAESGEKRLLVILSDKNALITILAHDIFDVDIVIMYMNELPI